LVCCLGRLPGVLHVPFSAAISLLLTEEDMERQFDQEQLVFSTHGSAKHNERASYEDMVRDV
jgi:hypothetical protein